MNNKSLSRITFVSASLAMLIIVFVGLSALAAGLGNTKQFAMDMTMSSDMGATTGQSMVVKFYVGKDRMRVETTMAGMEVGGASITVFDGDQTTMYVLMPQMKQYMKKVSSGDDDMEEGPGLVFGTPDNADHPCQSDPEITCEKIGSDSLLGRPVDKYLVKEVKDGVPTESIYWFDRELLFPLKTEGEEGVMEATSIAIGSQPDELFEIPAGYTEMQMSF